MHLIGLTGGTGSGKTEAGKRFADHGIAVIDADAVGHALIGPGGALEGQVRALFGPEIETHGQVDRKKLGGRVFSDSAARKQLNALVHPAIRAEVAQRAATLAEKGHSMLMIDAALLAERGERDAHLSGLVLVLASPEIRLKRLVESRGLDPEAAQRQIDAQTPPEHKRAAADWIIENDGTLEELHVQVDKVARELKGMMNDE